MAEQYIQPSPSQHFQPPSQSEVSVQQAAFFLDSRDLQLAPLLLDSISATASLPIDYKGFPLSGDSHCIIASPW